MYVYENDHQSDYRQKIWFQISQITHKNAIIKDSLLQQLSTTRGTCKEYLTIPTITFYQEIHINSGRRQLHPTEFFALSSLVFVQKLKLILMKMHKNCCHQSCYFWPRYALNRLSAGALPQTHGRRHGGRHGSDSSFKNPTHLRLFQLTFPLKSEK